MIAICVSINELSISQRVSHTPIPHTLSTMLCTLVDVVVAVSHVVVCCPLFFSLLRRLCPLYRTAHLNARENEAGPEGDSRQREIGDSILVRMVHSECVWCCCCSPSHRLMFSLRLVLLSLFDSLFFLSFCLLFFRSPIRNAH